MWSTIGQDHLLKQIDAALGSGRLAHAYLLSGPPHVGKMTMALDLAAAVNCAVVNGQQAGSMFDDQDEAPGPCGNCDCCLDPSERIDGTEDARKILSALHRSGQRFGQDKQVLGPAGLVEGNAEAVGVDEAQVEAGVHRRADDLLGPAGRPHGHGVEEGLGLDIELLG